MAHRIGQKKVLGLAIGEKSLVVAEASLAGEGQPRVTLAATFAYPEGQGLADGESLGKALGEFLKGRGFAARHVVVGVPARWVLSKSKEVPAADEAVVAEALRLQVEGEFSQELENLTFDYAGEPSTTESRNVLVVAIQDKHLQQVKALAEGARLSLVAVAPVGCVLGAAVSAIAGKPRTALVVSVGPGGVELAAQEGTSPRVLRHLGTPTSSPSILAGELRRAAIAAGGLPGVNGHGVNGVTNGSAVNGSSINGSNGHGPSLVLWDERLLAAASRQALADAVGARIEIGNLERLGVPAGLAGGEADATAVAGAAALAIAGVSEQGLPVNFLRSRLAEKKRSGPSRKVVYAVGGVVLAVVLGALAISDIQSKTNRLNQLETQLGGMAGGIKANKAFVEKVSKAQNWHREQPRFLQCLLDLHAAIPEDGRTIVTGITLKDSMKGTVAGRGDNPQTVVDNMRRSKRFSDTKLEWDKAKNGGDSTFTINFTYAPPAPTPAAKGATPAGPTPAAAPPRSASPPPAVVPATPPQAKPQSAAPQPSSTQPAVTQPATQPFSTQK